MAPISNTIPFDEIDVSTQTIIALTNITIDLKRLFDTLPVLDLPYSTFKTKRTAEEFILGQGAPQGSIISIKYKDDTRGYNLTKLKSKKNMSSKKYFRNAISIVMVVSNKLLNFKIPTKGKIQITGCKSIGHAEQCIQYLWCFLETDSSMYTVEGFRPEVYFNTVMTNINFDIGFRIVRERLDNYINTSTQYKSMLETSVGYAGVNIKFPFKHVDTTIRQMVYSDKKWVCETVSYDVYLRQLSTRDAKKEMTKKKSNTFLVFHRGTAIMSGMCPQHMRDAYYTFIDIVKHQARDYIEENIDAPDVFI